LQKTGLARTMPWGAGRVARNKKAPVARRFFI